VSSNSNTIVAASILLGSIFLVAILIKYIYTRRRTHRWIVRYPISRGSNEGTGSGFGPQESIYDNWLIVRFTTAFLFLEAFQILTVLSQIAQVNGNRKEALPKEADLSAAHASIDYLEFLPGVSTGLLVSS
jgi:hypothetical protein